MRAESALVEGQHHVGPGRGLPALVAVTVTDDVEVEPQLRRAAAELAALRLRLAAASRRAHGAESRALAAKPASGLTVDEETAALDERLQQERADHRRRLDDELCQIRAEGAELVASACAEAAAIVTAASGALAAASSTGGASVLPVAPLAAVVPPSTGTQRTPMPLASIPEEVPPRPSLVERFFRRDLGLSLIEVAIVVLLVALLVAVVR